MIVIDASALIEVLLGTANAAAIRTRVFAVGETLHGPHLLDIEVAQVLRRYVARRDLDVARAALALEHLAAFPIRRYAHTVLLPRIWASRDSITACDATYVALAEALDAPLITCDARLAAVPGHAAQIVKF